MTHIDSDELLFPVGDLRSTLSGYDSSVVRFAMKEAVAEQDHYNSRFDATYFREPLTSESKAKIAAALPAGCDDVLFEGEYFRGHTASKLAVRLIRVLKSWAFTARSGPDAGYCTDQ